MCDLDIDPIILTLELDLDTVIKFLCQLLQKISLNRQTQTDRHYENITSTACVGANNFLWDEE